MTTTPRQRLNDRLAALLQEYRNKEIDAGTKANLAAAAGDMLDVSEHSTASARYMEALMALGRAVKIVREELGEV